MIRYFDSSALVKRYVAERASSTVRKLLDTEHRATCRLALTELTSALARRTRDGDLTEEARDRSLARLARDFRRINVVELTPALVAEAQALLLAHPLRSSDALHLAAALRLRTVQGLPEYVCYDARLAAAARAEGLKTRPRSPRSG